VSPTFDPEKNAANIAKHGVSLAKGDGVLHDPLALTIEDDSARDEPRWVTIGMNTLALSWWWCGPIAKTMCA
jgi:uncharacterized DUF497 family protein